MMMEVAPQLAGYVSRCTCGIKVRIPEKAEPAPAPPIPMFRLPFVKPAARPRFLPNIAPKFRATQPSAWDEEEWEEDDQPIQKSLPEFDAKRNASISGGSMGMAFAMILLAICYGLGIELGVVQLFIAMLFLVGFISLIFGLFRV